MSVSAVLVGQPEVQLTISKEHALTLIGLTGHVRGGGTSHQHLDEIEQELNTGSQCDND